MALQCAMSEVRTFEVTARIDYGEQLDNKHFGYCRSCGCEIFEGDTVYDPHNDSPCCVDCFYGNGVSDRLLKTAGW